MNLLSQLRPERRAGIIFVGLMLVAAAVAIAGISGVTAVYRAGKQNADVEWPQYARAQGVESQMLAAQLFLQRARSADTVAERRTHFAAYAREVVAAGLRLEALEHSVPAGSRLWSLAADYHAAQREWSGRVREFIAATDAAATDSNIDPEQLWGAVEAAFTRVRARAVRMAIEGLLPRRAAQRAVLDARRDNALTIIGVVFVAGLLVGLAVINGSIRLIRRQRIAQDEENAYRDFDRRVQRAFELVETESDILSLVSDVLETAGGPQRRSELILADASRTKLKRVVNASSAPNCGGCPVPNLAECPTVRTNSRMIYASNQSFEACRYFKDRGDEPSSAACVPVSVMGRTVGVIHVVGPAAALPQPQEMRRFESIARKTGDRVGLARALVSKDEAANTDMLTGLANRRALELALPEIRAEYKTFAVAYGDLDHFKRLNDDHGHETGDRALRLFAQVLRNTLRPSDLICRWGGEEFVVIIPGGLAPQAVTALERVRSRLKDIVRASPVPEFTTSFGVSDSTMGDDFEEVLHRADTALMSAKQAGRNRVVLDRFEDSAQASEAAVDACLDDSANGTDSGEDIREAG